jgi:hypothetical protein
MPGALFTGLWLFLLSSLLLCPPLPALYAATPDPTSAALTAVARLVEAGVLPSEATLVDSHLDGDTWSVTLSLPGLVPARVDEAWIEAVVRAFPLALELRGVAVHVVDPLAPGGRRALVDLLDPVRPVPPRSHEQGARLASTPLVVPVDAPGRTSGALWGKHVYVSQGHGWTWKTGNGWAGWRTQRGNTWGAVEDFLNAEAINQYLLAYLENAGATVWPLREPDLNAHMVVVDDGDGDAHPENGIYEELGEGFETSTAPGYQGFGAPYGEAENPMNAGASRYHYTSPSTSVAGGARARWTPALPEEGYYRVAVSYAASPNRAWDAHFVVRHPGGEVHVRVDQRRHGHTWVDLGRFWFESGIHPETGSVEAWTDSSDNPGEKVVSLDAVRFGGGEGLILRGTATSSTDTPTSGFPRWEECARYAAQFNGAPSDVYDYRDADGSDDVVARSRYTAWQHEEGEDAVYVSWHTNAPNPGEGTSTYVYGPNGPPSPFSEFSGVADGDVLAQLLHQEVVNDIVNGYDPGWIDRGLHSAWFGELNPEHNPEVPAALVEVGFHDTESDCLKLQEPRLRNLVARAFVQAIVRFFAQKQGISPIFLPEPPTRFKVVSAGADRARLSWGMPPSDDGAVLGDPPTRFIVYRSADGRAFDNGADVGMTLEVELDAPPGQVHYFRVCAANEGGQSFATPTLAMLQPVPGTRGGLIVGAFDRLSRYQQVTQDLSAWTLGEVKRMLLHRMNSYQYVTRHAQALAALDVPFDSAWQDAPMSASEYLTYRFVDWMSGNESTEDHSFDAAELDRVAAFLDAGGALIVTGAEIGWDLVEHGTAEEAARFSEVFHAAYLGDDAETYHARLTNGIDLWLDEGWHGAYDVTYPDLFGPLDGGEAFAHYDGDLSTPAGTVYRAPEGGGVAILGFPLEATFPADARVALMLAMLAMLDVDPGQASPPVGPVEPTPEVVEPAADAGVEWRAPEDVDEGREALEALGEDAAVDTEPASDDAGSQGPSDAGPEALAPVSPRALDGGGGCTLTGWSASSP